MKLVALAGLAATAHGFGATETAETGDAELRRTLGATSYISFYTGKLKRWHDDSGYGCRVGLYSDEGANLQWPKCPDGTMEVHNDFGELKADKRYSVKTGWFSSDDFVSCIKCQNRGTAPTGVLGTPFKMDCDGNDLFSKVLEGIGDGVKALTGAKGTFHLTADGGIVGHKHGAWFAGSSNKMLWTTPGDSSEYSLLSPADGFGRLEKGAVWYKAKSYSRLSESTCNVRYQPDHVARVWKAEKHNEFGTEGIVDFPWPEQNMDGWGEGKANLGVCVSGGGSRTYTAGFGQIRALHALGHMEKVRYLEGVSGGAWVSSVYTYHQTGVDDSTLLGEVPELSELTMANMASVAKDSLGYGATQDMFAKLLGNVFKTKLSFTGVDPGDVWTEGFSEAVFDPYGLHTDKYFTLNTASRQRILDKNNDMKAEDFILPASESRPYLILPASVIGPNKPGSLEGKAPLLDGSKKAFSGMASTPLYSGYALAQDVSVHYSDGSILDKHTGGLVESFAFGGPAPGHLPFNFAPPETCVCSAVGIRDGGSGCDCSFRTEQQGCDAQSWCQWNVDTSAAPGEHLDIGLFAPEKPWSLKRAAGASSTWGDKDLAFLEMAPEGSRDCEDSTGKHCKVISGDGTVDMLTELFDYPLIGPQVDEWATSEASPITNTVRLGDGDVDGDVLGLMDVLVRNVDHSVSFLNTGTPLCSADVWDPASDITVEKLDECIDNYLPPLFGIEVTNSPNVWNTPERSTQKLQIFRSEDFAPFVKKMQDNLAAGKTAVAREKLTTVENAFSGIPAGHELDLCLFYLSSSPRFEAGLPADTRAELAKGEEGIFGSFPNYHTLLQNAILKLPSTLEEVWTAISNDEVDLIAQGLTSLLPEQVHLMAGLTSWAVMENRDLLADMFDLTPGLVVPPVLMG